MPASETLARKSSLRNQIRTALKAMSGEQRAKASAEACALLEKQAVWKEAQSLLFYAPAVEELDIWPLLRNALESGKTVALPRFETANNHYVACQIQDSAGDLASGQFGIREPKSHCQVLQLNCFDLVFVPGVAFDLCGRRLGRGKGFYDRLLALVRGTTCGVAFDEQIVESIPVEPHDIIVNCILTPTRWAECNK